MGKIFLLVGCLLAAASAAQGQGIADRCVRDSLMHQGLMRSYYVHVPERLAPEAQLLIVLHGYTGNAEGQKVQLVDLAEEMGFAVCFPQGLRDPKGKTSWNVGYPSQEGMETDDVDFLETLVRALQARYGLDPRNAFLSGMSNGGEMCYLTARRKPDLFAGIISIAGLTLSSMEPLHYEGAVPFMEVHGTADKTSYWTGDYDNRYGWGAYLAVPAAVGYVVAADGCRGYVRADATAGGKRVTRHRYYGGVPARNGQGPSCEVWLYEVDGGGHSWADTEFDVYHEMGRFIRRFSYPKD